MSQHADALIQAAKAALAAAADPAKAGPMAAYMKTEQPFYGVQSAARRQIARALRPLPLPTRADWAAAVTGLMRGSRREERYLAVAIARQRRAYHTPEALALYRQMIVDGPWWDTVDEIAGHLVGGLLLSHRSQIAPEMEAWIEDENLWIRRAALLSQLRHKAQTDPEVLFRHCLARAHETEFFTRKAIGWALRQYSYAAPEAVRAFLLENRDRLSGLSSREGAKGLRRAGRM